jgi:deoxyribodipyrimidine photo-lyase
LLVKAALELNEQWLNELIWREFFMMIFFIFLMLCPAVSNAGTIKLTGATTKKNLKPGAAAKRVSNCRCRNERLNETGFMHNRVRMIVASFLTKHLLVDWRMGEAYFAEKLIDYELSSNNGNWQVGCWLWVRCGTVFQEFSIRLSKQKGFDPDFIYIKKWIPDYRAGYLPEIVEHWFSPGTGRWKPIKKH